MSDDQPVPKRPSVIDQLNTEWEQRERVVVAATPLVQPTPDEARNGWTAETLTAYLADRRTAASLKNDKDSLQNRMAKMPGRQNKGGYRPLRWRA